MDSFEEFDILVFNTSDKWAVDDDYHAELFNQYEILHAQYPHRTLRHLAFLERRFDYISGGGASSSVIGGGNTLRQSRLGEFIVPDSARNASTLSRKPIHKPKDKYFTLERKGVVKVKKFNLTASTHELIFRNMDDISDKSLLGDRIENVFDKAVAHVLDEDYSSPDDRVGLEINYDGLKNGAILVPFCLKKEVTGAKILRLIERVLNSYQHISLHKPLSMRIVHVANPSGGGKLSHQGNKQLQCDFYNSKPGRKPIRRVYTSKDLLCFPKCVCLGISHIKCAKELRSLKRSDTLLRESAISLLRKAGIFHLGPCNFDDVRKIQDVIDERIIIFDRSSFGLGVLFTGNRQSSLRERGMSPNNNEICLELNDEHYSWLYSAPAYLGCKYFCVDCQVKFKSRENHRCGIYRCVRCLTAGYGNCDVVSWIQCDDCLRSFSSSICFDNHLKLTGKEKKTTCDLMKNCRKCGKMLHKKHKCFSVWCKLCGKYVPETCHSCFIQSYKTDDMVKKLAGEIVWPPIDKTKIIVYDFETAANADNVHEVVFACAQVFCDVCRDSWDVNIDCEQCCETPQRIWYGVDSLREFCVWLFSDSHAGSIAFGHFASGFDCQFICRYLIEQGTRMDIINKGMSILSLTACSVRLLCSHSFLPFPLKALPKLFNFESVCEKGDFAFKILKNDNINNMRRTWPTLEEYDIKYKRENDYNSMIAWHKTVADKPFYLLSELKKYCINDCTVLRTALGKFRQLFREIAFVDPFDKSCCTIASCCMLSYRHSFMREFTMQIIPESGFNSHRAQSIKALKYLKYRSFTEKVVIQTAASAAGEARLRVGKSRFYADGVIYDGDKIKTIIEFNGCLFHGCISCFPHLRNAKHLGGKDTYEDVYQRSEARLALIAQFFPDATIEVIWEHEYDAAVRDDPDFEWWLREIFHVVEPIQPRDAFTGGRCEVMKMRESVADSDNEWLDYVDYTSLYPWVNKYCRYPVGEVTLIDKNIKVEYKNGHQYIPYFGIVKLRIVPMAKLLHPVLPLRGKSGKLIFPLCSICAESQSAVCDHSAIQRSWYGTYAIPEVNLALEHGYEIVKNVAGDYEIFEVWHWDDSVQYSGKDSYSLFSGYVDRFLKIKTEAQGFPSYAVSTAEKLEYIERFEKHEGIKLDYDKVEKNPPLRQISKQMLNSLWGKWAQRSDNLSCKYITNQDEFTKLIFDPEFEVHSVTAVSSTMVLVQYKQHSKHLKPVKTQAVIHALLTSAYGRMKLFNELHALGSRVVYCDTDSIIFRNGPGYDYAPSLGDFLGDLTSELDDGEKIIDFCASAPKSYSFRTKNTQSGKESHTLKIKGFSLDVESKKALNHESMCAAVDNFVRHDIQDKIMTAKPGLKRCNNRQLVNVIIPKTFQVVSTKRIVCSDSSLAPFGYFSQSFK